MRGRGNRSSEAPILETICICNGKLSIVIEKEEEKGEKKAGGIVALGLLPTNEKM